MAPDDRPPVAVGHVRLASPQVEPTVDFLVKLGLRPLVTRPDFAVLELRGGTHLVVAHSDEPTPAGAQSYFDLMVDDIEATHKRYAELGLGPSAIQAGAIHSSFTVVEPGGHRITINSSHAGDRPV